MSDAPAPDPYEAVLTDLRAQREKINQAIALLESLRGRSPVEPLASEASSPPLQSQSATGEIRPGEFLGMTIVDAAKKLLTRERRAMGNAEILAALERGGLVLKSADPMNVVSSVLTRRFGQVGDVVRVARGTWGLKEWYPNRSFKPPKADDRSTSQPLVQDGSSSAAQAQSTGLSALLAENAAARAQLEVTIQDVLGGKGYEHDDSEVEFT